MNGLPRSERPAAQIFEFKEWIVEDLVFFSCKAWIFAFLKRGQGCLQKIPPIGYIPKDPKAFCRETIQF